MKNKICLITGGNAGIGKATAVGLAKQGAQVVIVSRSEEKAQQAVKDIIAQSNNQQVDYLIADLASQQSIRQLAAEFKSKYSQLHVLVNNAGAFFSEYGLTEDGIERQWAVNHLAPFLLTNLLLDVLKASAPARIVNVSSRAHYRGKIDFEDLNGTKNYDGFFKAYSQSKLANVLFTAELDRRLKGTGVTANSLHPGVVSTEIAQKNSSGWAYWGWTFLRPFMVSTEQGAATSVFLASSPKVEGVSGKYFEKSKEKKPGKLAQDAALAKRLWEVSAQLTKLETAL
ncbi:MAG: SDR family oxidoreductase [Chitinophagales bacterium]|nr:SDR family oxidoreductase [Chitinophagales bacterium]